MKRLLKLSFLAGGLLLAIFILTGCENSRTVSFSQPDIKDDFCGVVMNFQYCKCAFHNEFCEEIGMSSKEADKYVQEEYEKWLVEQQKSFGQKCEEDGGIYDGGKHCEYCQEFYTKVGQECVKNDESANTNEDDLNGGNSNEELNDFVPEGPLNSDCTVQEEQFNSDWEKYSDFDYRLEPASRSYEVQQASGIYEKMVELMAQNRQLAIDMELDREARVALREYKTALVNNLRNNIVKSIGRMAYITGSTIWNTRGAGTAYSKLFLSANAVEKVGAALKVFQAAVPKNSAMAIDTKTISGKVEQAGLKVAIEAINSLGNPVAIGTKVVEGSYKVAMPSAELTTEELNILKEQHLTNQILDQALEASYKENALSQAQILANEQEIGRLEVEAKSWEDKEKLRVKEMLEKNCQEQRNKSKSSSGSGESSWNIFWPVAHAQTSLTTQTLELGNYRVDYQEIKTAEEGHQRYYQDGNLVLSAYDNNNDDQIDLWLKYGPEMFLTLEAYDTDSDGQADTFVELDQTEKVTNLIKPIKATAVVATTTPSNNLSDIYFVKTEKSSSKLKVWLAIIALALVAGAVLKLRKKNKS
jgi:hypothetical protein